MVHLYWALKRWVRFRLQLGIAYSSVAEWEALMDYVDSLESAPVYDVLKRGR